MPYTTSLVRNSPQRGHCGCSENRKSTKLPNPPLVIALSHLVHSRAERSASSPSLRRRARCTCMRSQARAPRKVQFITAAGADAAGPDEDAGRRGPRIAGVFHRTEELWPVKLEHFGQPVRDRVVDWTRPNRQSDSRLRLDVADERQRQQAFVDHLELTTLRRFEGLHAHHRPRSGVERGDQQVTPRDSARDLPRPVGRARFEVGNDCVHPRAARRAGRRVDR